MRVLAARSAWTEVLEQIDSVIDDALEQHACKERRSSYRSATDVALDT